MSDKIKHECGIALIRLRKPTSYYLSKYGTSFYGANKLYLLMEKQHNRGQDGAGASCIKIDQEAGKKFIDRYRSIASNPIKDIFSTIFSEINDISEGRESRMKDTEWLKANTPFTGELFLGHLRYGTFGKNTVESCHPFIRNNNWRTRNLVVAGNFNMTNVDELFKVLLSLGQHPVYTSDTITVMEKLGHFLDEENQRVFDKYKKKGVANNEISRFIAEELDVLSVLKKAAKDFDGGYAMAGLIGHGDSFVIRDPRGIRPAYYYADDEVVVAASERPAIMTAFGANYEDIKELAPSHALIVKKSGDYSVEAYNKIIEPKKCSFERIYFSRGTDKEIYKERKNLGKALVPAVLNVIGHDLHNTVFSYIPNTASVAFRGLAEELDVFCNKIKASKINALLEEDNTTEKLEEILALRPRIEKIAVKDVKMRTFITQDNQRDDLVAHVYDVTYGCIKEGVDSLVVLDDSIVRGTTLKKSILHILDKLGPVKIVIVSSAPQIRYPDCYGIDMAKLSDFIAFKAVIALLKERKMEDVISKTYQQCKEEEKKPIGKMHNKVKAIYKPFSAIEISDKIAELLITKEIKAKVKIVYQSIEDLHDSCPDNKGDWYFTGNYPTPGGNRVVNRSFINYVEGLDKRAY
jgi:amidophosphoribosyltransferase